MFRKRYRHDGWSCFILRWNPVSDVWTTRCSWLVYHTVRSPDFWKIFWLRRYLMLLEVPPITLFQEGGLPHVQLLLCIDHAKQIRAPEDIDRVIRNALRWNAWPEVDQCSPHVWRNPAMAKVRSVLLYAGEGDIKVRKGTAMELSDLRPEWSSCRHCSHLALWTRFAHAVGRCTSQARANCAASAVE